MSNGIKNAPASPAAATAEHQRLLHDGPAWRRWGPYLADRAWGTVREDYSANGDAWNYFPHDHAHLRAYRWNEDGLGGFSDDKGYCCFALALWNGHDPILKERLFGLAGPQGNHGEDVKEYYFYTDNTPSHAWMQMVYKYPQAAFPYADLVAENARRGKDDPEYELFDTGIFDDNRYFDVFVEYAKASPADILIRIRAVNRGPQAAPLHLLPTLWFRNVWSWGDDIPRPTLTAQGDTTVQAQHPMIGTYTLHCATVGDTPPTLLFTENDTNLQRLFDVPNPSPYVKDAFHRYLINDDSTAVNPARTGTKMAAHYQLTLAPGQETVVQLRFSAIPSAMPAQQNTDEPPVQPGDGDAVPSAAPVLDPFADCDALIDRRKAEADQFYEALLDADVDRAIRSVHRQALAGLLWCKQFYHYQVRRWLEGDPGQPTPPASRLDGRNAMWQHMYNERVMSMPDAWEYPWYAAWDLAFHAVPLAQVDPAFAKRQIDLLLREWYQHPNGQVPAYEWNFSDVNPPVQAWAAWRIYRIEQQQYGHADRAFLERVFHKLLLYFTWWVNRKDSEGNNVFEGGFLGLDNIGVFDRSADLPTGGHLEQSDGTSWMGMFCLDMLTIALELARENQVYEAIATKFFEHFLGIAQALNNLGNVGVPLWNEDDQFFYDVLHLPDGELRPIKVRSFVGLIPLFAVRTIEPDTLAALPEFKQRLEWYLQNRPDLADLISRWYDQGVGERRMVALCRGHRMKRLLLRALDPQEFLSDHGIRALSRYHAEHPYVLTTERQEYTVRYEPAESRSGVFGGNSNWRGPVWFPLNFLLIEALQKYHGYYGDDFVVECPTGSGQYLSLDNIADELSRRLISLFTPGPDGVRPVYNEQPRFQHDEHWHDYVLFYEYFNGDTGAGLGASHQTGWTALVAELIMQQFGKR